MNLFCSKFDTNHTYSTAAPRGAISQPETQHERSTLNTEATWFRPTCPDDPIDFAEPIVARAAGDLAHPTEHPWFVDVLLDIPCDHAASH